MGSMGPNIYSFISKLLLFGSYIIIGPRNRYSLFFYPSPFENPPYVERPYPQEHRPILSADRLAIWKKNPQNVTKSRIVSPLVDKNTFFHD